MTKSHSKTRILVEGALMIAMAMVLSKLKLFELFNGGSITMASLLPLIMMSYRNGAKWGCFTGFVHALLQLLLDNGIAYVMCFQTVWGQLGCLLLDYFLAFTMLGLCCLISDRFANRYAGIAVSIVVVNFLRFMCSFLSGLLLWGKPAGADVPAWAAWFSNGSVALYSLVYNAIYIIPDALIVVVCALLLYKAAPKLFARQA